MRILIPSLKPESQYIVRIAPSRNIQQKPMKVECQQMHEANGHKFRMCFFKESFQCLTSGPNIHRVHKILDNFDESYDFRQETLKATNFLCSLY